MIIAPTSEQWSVVAGMEGRIAGWDYDGALNYNRSSIDTVYAGSNARESALIPLLNSGVINPFGPNTQAVIDALAATEVNRTLRTGKASLASFDFHVSKRSIAFQQDRSGWPQVLTRAESGSNKSRIRYWSPATSSTLARCRRFQGVALCLRYSPSECTTVPVVRSRCCGPL